jgi:PKD repeat protein
MPLQLLQFRPGINREGTTLANEGGWYDGDKIRFRSGYPQKLGGWQPISSNTYLGTARALINWVTLRGYNLLGVGTNLKYYVESGGVYNDITPIRDTNVLTNPFTTELNSTTVTVTDPGYGGVTGDFVTFSGATAVGGLTLNGEFQITNIDFNTYSIQASSPATSSPAAVFSSSTAASPSVTFATAGSYTLTLLASNSSGTNSATQVVLVQSCTTPTASFTSAATGCAKVTYTVANTTSASPAATYSWTTNPTASVSISNAASATPSFTFNAPGVYSIGLVATNITGSNSAVKVVTISACPPNAGFNIPAIGCLTTAVSSTNTTTSSITPITYNWSSNPVGAQFSNPTAPAPAITFTATGNYTVSLIATNASGSITATQTINISTCNSINENNGVLNSISLFPNPSNGVFNVATTLSNDNINYSVTNILGATIATGKFNSSKNIDLSSQSKGVYFITFENNGSKMTKKIILE